MQVHAEREVNPETVINSPLYEPWSCGARPAPRLTSRAAASAQDSISTKLALPMGELLRERAKIRNSCMALSP